MVVGVDDVSFGPADGQCFPVFNTSEEFPLSGIGDANATKWTARFDGISYVGGELQSNAFNKLRVKFNAVGPSAGPNGLNYSNAPSDISDERGRMLGAFSGFPM